LVHERESMDFGLVFLVLTECTIMSFPPGVGKEMWADRFKSEFSGRCIRSLETGFEGGLAT